MGLRDEFLTEEAWRYAAECRRMARLARGAERKPVAVVSPHRRFADWLGRLFGEHAADQFLHGGRNIRAQAAQRRRRLVQVLMNDRADRSVVEGQRVREASPQRPGLDLQRATRAYGKQRQHDRV